MGIAQRRFLRGQERMGHAEKVDGAPWLPRKVTDMGRQFFKYINARAEEHRKKIEAKRAARMGVWRNG